MRAPLAAPAASARAACFVPLRSLRGLVVSSASLLSLLALLALISLSLTRPAAHTASSAAGLE